MANNKIYSDYLMHYRTKGSRNGYSKDPNYTPVGRKAEGAFDAQRQHARNIASSGIHLAARSAGLAGVGHSQALTQRAYAKEAKWASDHQRERDAEEIANRNRNRGDLRKAVYDARHDKDFGSFIRKDISDRAKNLVKKGKNKVSKLLNKLKPQTKTSISSKTDLLEGHIDNRPREKQIRRKK